MATVISRKIGPGQAALGGYDTLQDWENACPTDLVAVNQIWQGQLIAGEHVFATQPLSIGSQTVTSADCYIELTTDTGASFLDHPDLATNPLRYDATKGAAIKFTGIQAAAIVANAYHTRINKIQMLGTATSSEAWPMIASTGTSPVGIHVDQCILESSSRHLDFGTIMLKGSGSKITNTVIINHSTTISAIIAGLQNGASMFNCTLIALGAALTNGLKTSGAAGELKNVYIGGAVNPHNNGSTMTKTNCYSDVAATDFSVAPLSTATFENVTAGTHDFRLKSGSALIDTGITDTTTGSTDIYGTSRPQGAGYDVGAWEWPVVVLSPTLTITSTEVNDAHSVTADVEISSVALSIASTEASDTHSITGSVDTTSGQLTTRIIKNNAGIARVNLANCTINIYNATTGALVLRKTGLTTNSAGRLVVLDAALAKATVYAYEIDLSAAGFGRRLPTGTTV